MKKSKTERKLGTEPGIDEISEQLPRVQESEIDSRYLHSSVAESEQEAVLLGHAIKTPRMIRHIVWKVTYFFHPVASPRTGIEVRNDAKRTSTSLFQPPSHF